GDVRAEAGLVACLDELAAAVFTAGDPGRVAVVQQRLAGFEAEQVHRVVEQVGGADVIRCRVVVAEDDGGVDLPGPQQVECHLGVGVGQVQFDAGVLTAQGRCGVRYQGGERRLEAGDPDSAGSQAHHRGQFRGGGGDPADDVGGAAGQVLALRREPDAPANPLDEPGAGFGLQPGQMVADGWLRVVQLLGGFGDRAVRGDRRENP